jgi:peptidoglycan/LPS O-acetylase OafA/YrhL
VTASCVSGQLTKESARSAESTNLDLLRAFAVLCVYFSHLPLSQTGFFYTVQRHLATDGVLIFFVHTSLVLMRSLDRTRSRFTFSSFYIRRAFRIYPLTWFGVALVVSLSLGEPGHVYHPIGMRGLAANVFLVQNITHSRDVIATLWSLAWEVQMYIALPVVWLLLRCSASSTVLAVAIWLVSMLASLNLSHGLEYPALFLGGVVAWSIERRLSPVFPAFLWPASVCILLVVRSFVRQGFDFYLPRNMLVDAFSCLTLGLLLPWFLDLSPSALTRFSHLVARYSFGIYLFHLPIMWLCFDKFANVPFVGRLTLLIFLSIVVPVLGYHALEEPMIRLGKTLTKNR